MKHTFYNIGVVIQGDDCFEFLGWIKDQRPGDDPVPSHKWAGTYQEAVTKVNRLNAEAEKTPIATRYFLMGGHHE